MCYTGCRDEQGAVMYSAVLSQYNIMNHNERCEETRCYTIKLKTSLLTFVDKVLGFSFIHKKFLGVGEFRRKSELKYISKTILKTLQKTRKSRTEKRATCDN